VEGMSALTTEAMLALSYTAPDETTDEEGMVRVCEVSVDIGGTKQHALYRFNLKTGDLHISVINQFATINTAPILGRLFDAIGGQHAQAH
jgi:hypothetical protein